MMRRAIAAITLIELLMVVVVIAILMALAYPSYRNHIIKNNRTIAQQDLQSAAKALEAYYLMGNTYIGATLGPNQGNGNAFVNWSPSFEAQADAIYALSIAQQSQNFYALQATPINGTLQEGNGLLRMESDGLTCWDSDNSGACCSPASNCTEDSISSDEQWPH